MSEVLADGSVRLGEEARRAGYTPGTLVEVIVSSARGTLILALHDASPTTVDGAALEVARRRHAEARQALADMRKVRGLVRVDGDAPALTGATAGKPWSRDYPACRHCGTTERAHGGRGLCGRDYQRWMKGAIEGDY